MIQTGFPFVNTQKKEHLLDKSWEKILIVREDTVNYVYVTTRTLSLSTIITTSEKKLFPAAGRLYRDSESMWKNQCSKQVFSDGESRRKSTIIWAASGVGTVNVAPWVGIATYNSSFCDGDGVVQFTLKVKAVLPSYSNNICHITEEDLRNVLEKHFCVNTVGDTPWMPTLIEQVNLGFGYWGKPFKKEQDWSPIPS